MHFTPVNFLISALNPFYELYTATDLSAPASMADSTRQSESNFLLPKSHGIKVSNSNCGFMYAFNGDNNSQLQLMRCRLQLLEVGQLLVAGKSPNPLVAKQHQHII